MSGEWQVEFTAKASKQARKLAKRERDTLLLLVEDMKHRGPVLYDWSNYSRLGDERYHCHLSYKWVACWELKDSELRIIDIYYVGSRENAPY